MGIVAIFAVAVFSIALPAHAANLAVDFETDPLFGELNFLPGNGISKTISVENHAQSLQEVAIESINVSDPNGFGDALRLVIREGEAIRYDGTLGAFLRGGKVVLSELAPNAKTAYTLAVSFTTDVGNDSQKKTLGFDLCVGFSGGERHCGDTVIGSEGDTGDGTGNGDGGTIRGSGGGPINPTVTLQIASEVLASVDTSAGTAVIEWDTNLLATGQVIYGPLLGGPYRLDLNIPPYFGYPSGTPEDFNKTNHHRVVLAGLVPGESYKFRVVSRASPPTVGFEYSFTFLPGVGARKTLALSLGEVAGASVTRGSDSGFGFIPQVFTDTERIAVQTNTFEKEEREGTDGMPIPEPPLSDSDTFNTEKPANSNYDFASRAPFVLIPIILLALFLLYRFFVSRH